MLQRVEILKMNWCSVLTIPLLLLLEQGCIGEKQELKGQFLYPRGQFLIQLNLESGQKIEVFKQPLANFKCIASYQGDFVFLSYGAPRNYNKYDIIVFDLKKGRISSIFLEAPLHNKYWYPSWNPTHGSIAFNLSIYDEHQGISQNYLAYYNSTDKLLKILKHIGEISFGRIAWSQNGNGLIFELANGQLASYSVVNEVLTELPVSGQSPIFNRAKTLLYYVSKDNREIHALNPTTNHEEIIYEERGMILDLLDVDDKYLFYTIGKPVLFGIGGGEITVLKALNLSTKKTKKLFKLNIETGILIKRNEISKSPVDGEKPSAL